MIVMLCHTVVSEWIINKCIQTSFTVIIDICNSIWTVDVRLCLKSTITRNQCVVMYSRNCTRDNRRTDVAEETMMISEDFLIFHSWWTESAISSYILSSSRTIETICDLLKWLNSIFLLLHYLNLTFVMYFQCVDWHHPLFSHLL